MIVLSAALMGLAYGATAPSSTHLLVPRTPKPHMNVVLSLRQIGVPLGGMLAGLLMPPLALAVGWRTALLLQLVPTLLLLAALEAARHRWDAPLPGQTPASVGIRAMVRLLKGDRPLQRLSFASFVYAGLQICFIAFMTTQLTTVVGMPLIQAGQILALYQLAGVVSRPVWGWLADHVMPARLLLALQGAIMCLAAVLTGRFAPDWPVAMIALVSIAGGATASGYTGIAYAEYARLGGPRRTEATGLGSAFMFAGVMVLPAAMSGVVTLAGSYAQVYSVIGALALVAGLGLVWGIREAPRRS
jgi:nitrate/nitrite transporter NarK